MASRMVAAACRVERSPSLPRRRETLFGERLGLTLRLGLPDQERCTRFWLRRDQRPREALQETRGDGLVGLRLPLGSLVLLVLGQVEVGLVGENMGPSQVVAGRGV